MPSESQGGDGSLTVKIRNLDRCSGGEKKTLKSHGPRQKYEGSKRYKLYEYKLIIISFGRSAEGKYPSVAREGLIYSVGVTNHKRSVGLNSKTHFAQRMLGKETLAKGPGPSICICFHRAGFLRLERNLEQKSEARASWSEMWAYHKLN